MQTELRFEGSQALFVVTGLDAAYHDAARRLAFEPIVGGVARRFPADSPHLDRVYGNFARAIEEVILQRVGARPVPWDAALEALLQRVEGQAIDWWLVGSAALAVRGLAVTPGDIDLAVDVAGAHRLGELLLDDLIEPCVPIEGWICEWFGRAFLGARVEWIGGANDSADQPEASDSGPAAFQRREIVTWRGYRVQVPPLELQLAVCERRGFGERAALIRRALGNGP